MELTKLFEKIAGKHRARQQSRKAGYRELISMIADGRDPDADFLDRVLIDNGKSLADVRQAVDLLLERRELRKTYDSIPAMNQEYENLHAQIGEAERIHDERTQPLYWRIEQIRQTLNEGRNVRARLWETCADTELCGQLSHLRQRLTSLHDQQSQLMKNSSDLRNWAETDRVNSNQGVLPAKAESLKERAKSREAKAKQLEEELATVRTQIAECDHEESRIRELMLVP
ncbi:hypothetical protein CA54_21860 [Symmachiella macrocystis]|uniref:Uncharacterized protein n=1 Tax=Symmachiella macrocystis TaxID=2527985 RepID=A0A5C6BPM8_9PLAN|nr:hypothetical protein [Symmachiella macrocystis]TWU13351.1 hypothetical protein CA54_21860 [Symmachiella macrocystis]